MNFKNNAFSVLASPITAAATAITVATGTGGNFPTGDFPVTLIGYDGLGNENAWEIAYCTTRSGDVLTVQRAREGTTAQAWPGATRIENRLTAGSLPSGGIVYSRKTATYTLSNQEGVIADTSGGSFTVRLPASPQAGHFASIADGADWSVNNLTVDPQGATIEGQAAGETLLMDIGGISADFVFDGARWQVYARVGGGVPRATDAQLRDRATHTGEQAMSTITGLSAALAALAPLNRQIIPVTGNVNATLYALHVLTGTGGNITLPANPSAGNWMQFANFTGLTTQQILRNGRPIMNLAEDMNMDEQQRVRTLFFVDNTIGWILQ